MSICRLHNPNPGPQPRPTNFPSNRRFLAVQRKVQLLHQYREAASLPERRRELHPHAVRVHA